MSTTTTYPNCTLCGEPLTDNERDTEPGSNGSFFSAHHRCYAPTRDGAWAVTVRWDTDRPNETYGRYTCEAAAVQYAQHLAGSNYSDRPTRYVVTGPDGDTLTLRGQLRNPNAVTA